MKLYYMVLAGFACLGGCGPAGTGNHQQLGGIHVGNPMDTEPKSASYYAFESAYGYSLQVPTKLSFAREQETQSLADLRSLDDKDFLQIEVVEAERGPRTREDFAETIEKAGLPKDAAIQERSNSQLVVVRPHGAKILKEERFIFSPSHRIVRAFFGSKDLKGFEAIGRSLDRMNFDLSAPQVRSLQCGVADGLATSIQINAEIEGEHPSQELQAEVIVMKRDETNSGTWNLYSMTSLSLARVEDKKNQYVGELDFGESFENGNYVISQISLEDYSGNKLILLQQARSDRYFGSERSVISNGRRQSWIESSIPVVNFSIPLVNGAP